MPLDPQAATLLELLESLSQGPLEDMELQQARDTALLLTGFDGDPEPVEEVVDRTVPGPAGEIPVRLYRPADDHSLPIVAWFHAGGGVIGDLETADRQCRRVANRSNALVVSVDYRRAPEHRFPAAVDDCWAVTQWLGEHGGDIGGDASRLAVAGDSMGATFAAVVAQRAAATGAPRLRHQVLIYPFTDLTMSHPSIDEHANGYLLTKSLYRWFASEYLGPDGDAEDPAASPLLSSELGGCAPALIITAEFDPARDEAEEYAKRLLDAGVPVVLDRYDGMIHVFFALAGAIDRAVSAADRVGEVLSEALR